MRYDVLRDPEIATRISAYELAYRMQTAAPEAFDVQREPEHVKRLYGLDEKHCAHFAAQCLTARRMVERGVRFVTLLHASWDHHSNIDQELPFCAGMADQPIAALVRDLKQRGMLDDTMVIWASEFGRTPQLAESGYNQTLGAGHYANAWTTWMAGAGVRGGCPFHFRPAGGARMVLVQWSLLDWLPDVNRSSTPRRIERHP